MAEITQTILTAISNDLSIDTRNLCVGEKATGFMGRKKNLHIFGSVHSQDQLAKVEAVVRKHAGTTYAVENHLTVK